MTAFRMNKATDLSSAELGISVDLMLSHCQESLAETRLYQYQLEQQKKTLGVLEKKIEGLEIHRATQVGQDKIISFLVGAIVLSLLSLVTTIFFRPQEISPSSQSQAPSVTEEVVLPPHIAP